jgi:hypothetical protein
MLLYSYLYDYWLIASNFNELFNNNNNSSSNITIFKRLFKQYYWLLLICPGHYFSRCKWPAILVYHCIWRNTIVKMEALQLNLLYRTKLSVIYLQPIETHKDQKLYPIFITASQVWIAPLYCYCSFHCSEQHCCEQLCRDGTSVNAYTRKLLFISATSRLKNEHVHSFDATEQSRGKAALSTLRAASSEARSKHTWSDNSQERDAKSCFKQSCLVSNRQLSSEHAPSSSDQLCRVGPPQRS